MVFMYNFHQSRQHFFFAPCIGENFIGPTVVHVYSFPIEVVDFLRAIGQEGSCPYFHVCDDVLGFPVYEEDEACLMESFYVFISFNDSASGGYDEVLTEGKVLNCPFFCVTEGFFAFGEEAFDGPFFFIFQVFVGIDEGPGKDLGYGFAEGGFAASRHADEDDIFHFIMSFAILAAISAGISRSIHISSAAMACMTSMYMPFDLSAFFAS